MPDPDRRREARREACYELLDIPHCSLQPTPTQAGFLLDLGREALYGGAAGGGKSIALFMAALQFSDVAGYSAIIFRRNLSDLRLPSGLLSVSAGLLSGTGARWSAEDNTWYFGSGARLVFGYLDHEATMYRYQGAEFQYIGFDELTQFPEHPYLYLFSRLRRPDDPTRPASNVPLRMRATANPGGAGHDWVRARFIEPSLAEQRGEARRAGRSFHPARLSDNPYLDQAEYRTSLENLPFGLRRQLLDGDWDIRPHGGVFERDWFPIVSRDTVPAGLRAVRAWDLAATEPRAGADPDYTVGLRVDFDPHSGMYYVTDVVRFRGTAHQVEQRVRATAETDGRYVDIVMEQEPGSAGKILIDHYRRNVLNDRAVHAERPTGDKVTRAQLAASRAEAGELAIVAAPWNTPMLDELEVFPQTRHDDQVDALALALHQHAQTPQTGDMAEVFGQINDSLRCRNSFVI